MDAEHFFVVIIPTKFIYADSALSPPKWHFCSSVSAAHAFPYRWLLPGSKSKNAAHSTKASPSLERPAFGLIRNLEKVFVLGLSHLEDLGAASFASPLSGCALVLQRDLLGTLNIHLFPALHTIGLHNITLLVFDWG